MASNKRTGGRPRSISRHATPELRKLADFLWDTLDGSGTSVPEAQARFTDEHFPQLPVPSVATVYKRLRCEGLLNDGRMVDAIVDICTPPARLEAVRRQATELKSLARAHRPETKTTPSSDDCRAHLTQLSDAQQRLLDMQQELFRLKEGWQESKSSNAPELPRLSQELDRVRAERQKYADQLAAARREIQTLKTQLATATPVLYRGDDDPELDHAERELRRLDPDGKRFAAAIRRAFDVVYDGARTGRFSPTQLLKAEKTHLLAVVKSEVRREFGFEEGEQLDFRINGVDFDCRFSQSGSWAIPPEAVSRLCLLVSADDTRSSFTVGLLRVTPTILSPGHNRDLKRFIGAAGRASMRFLVRNGALPENVLLHMDDADVASVVAERTGQARVAELFRRVQNRKVDRASLRAVAMQEQATRRAHDARSVLAAEGVLVVGQTAAWVCAALGLPEPGRGEFVSVRLARHRPHHSDVPTVELGGESWVVATVEDPVEPIPVI